MEKKIIWACRSFAIALLLQLRLSAAPTLAVAQSPSASITSSNLSGGGGSDLTATLTSPTALSLNVSGAVISGLFSTSLTNWYCYFSLGSASSNWPSNLTLSVKLSSAGSGNGNAYSSTNGTYAVLTTTPQAIFYGQGNQSGITVQCQLNNLSLANCPPISAATLPLVMTLQSQ